MNNYNYNYNYNYNSYRDKDSDFKKDSKFSRGDRKGGRPKRRMIHRLPPPKDFKIDYKNFTGLQKYVNERGKVLPHRISGFKAKEQRRLIEAIKRARFLALLPSGSVKKI